MKFNTHEPIVDLKDHRRTQEEINATAPDGGRELGIKPMTSKQLAAMARNAGAVQMKLSEHYSPEELEVFLSIMVLIHQRVFGVTDEGIEYSMRFNRRRIEQILSLPILPGMAVRFHPIIGGKHDGRMYALKSIDAATGEMMLNGEHGPVGPVDPRAVSLACKGLA